MDANTLGWIIFISALGLTWISMRSPFFGLKLMSGAWWFIVVMYLVSNPPSAITAGNNLHTALIVTSIGLGLMVILSGLGRGIQRSEKWNEKGDTQTTEGFHFKLPDWLNASEDSPEARKRQTDASLAEYRDRLQRALRTGSHRAGRR